jgi:hypothetical protein
MRHNRSKRPCRKELIVQWLVDHYITVSVKATKTEILELTFDNLLKKRYVIDKIARKFNVDISPLFVLFRSIFTLISIFL